MAYPNPYRQYQTTQVNTAGPLQLTLLCYDGALRFLAQGRDAMLARRYDVQSERIGRAQALLSELLAGLDFAQGGPVAQSLDGLYRYLHDRLSHASVHDDVAALDEVRAHLSELRAAWSQIGSADEPAGSAPAPGAGPAAGKLALSV